MEFWRFLHHLEEFEQVMADLYRTLARLHGGDAEAEDLFDTLAKGEVSHRDIIRYERRLVHNNPDEFVRSDFDPGSIGEAAAKAQAATREAASLSLEQALRVSFEIESSAAEHHYQTAMAQSNPAVAAMVRQLDAYDKEHIEVLRAFAKKRGFALQKTSGHGSESGH